MGVVGRQEQTHLIHKILALDRTREAASTGLITVYSKINQRPAGLEKVLTKGLQQDQSKTSRPRWLLSKQLLEPCGLLVARQWYLISVSANRAKCKPSVSAGRMWLESKQQSTWKRDTPGQRGDSFPNSLGGTHPLHTQAATQKGHAVEYRGHNPEEMRCPDSLCSPDNQPFPLPFPLPPQLQITRDHQVQIKWRRGATGTDFVRKVWPPITVHQERQSWNRDLFMHICGHNNDYSLSPCGFFR